MFGLVVIAALRMMAGIEILNFAGRTCTHSNASFIDYSICANIRRSIFRSWLTGQPRYLVLLAVFIIISAFNTMADDFFTLSGPKSILGAVNILGLPWDSLAATF